MSTTTRGSCSPARAFGGGADLRGDRIGEMRDQRLLQIRRRTEMMEQIGMRPPDSRSDGLERDGLRTLFDEQGAGGLDRGLARFFGAETFADY